MLVPKVPRGVHQINNQSHSESSLSDVQIFDPSPLFLMMGLLAFFGGSGGNEERDSDGDSDGETVTVSTVPRTPFGKKPQPAINSYTYAKHILTDLECPT